MLFRKKVRYAYDLTTSSFEWDSSLPDGILCDYYYMNNINSSTTVLSAEQFSDYQRMSAAVDVLSGIHFLSS